MDTKGAVFMGSCIRELPNRQNTASLQACLQVRPQIPKTNIQTLQTKASDHTHCRQAVNQELKEICL